MLAFLEAGKEFSRRMIRSGVVALIKKGASSKYNYLKRVPPSRELKNVGSVSVQILVQPSLLIYANGFDSQ